MFVLGSVIHESPNLSLAKLGGSQQNLFFDPIGKKPSTQDLQNGSAFLCLHKS